MAASAKVVVLGPPYCRKSAFIAHLPNATTEELEWGVKRTIASVATTCGPIDLDVWELTVVALIPGEPHATTSAHCGDANALVIKYSFDITSDAMLRVSEALYYAAREECGAVPTVLVGNKGPTAGPPSATLCGFAIPNFSVDTTTGAGCRTPLRELLRTLLGRPDLEITDPDPAPELTFASDLAPLLDVAANIKIVLVGDGGVGKTAFLKRHVTGDIVKCYDATVGCDRQRLVLRTNAGPIAFDVWDIAGQERMAPVRSGFYEGAHAALLAFDLLYRGTYGSVVTKWYPEVVDAVGAEIPFVLMGLKADDRMRCSQRIKPEKIIFHRQKGMTYYAVSSRTGANMLRPFLDIARHVTGNMELVFESDPEGSGVAPEGAAHARPTPVELSDPAHEPGVEATRLLERITVETATKDRLIVRNLDVRVDEATLREAFAACGQITTVVVPVFPDGKSRGFGFVQFADAADAEKVSLGRAASPSPTPTNACGLHCVSCAGGPGTCYQCENGYWNDIGYCLASDGLQCTTGFTLGVPGTDSSQTFDNSPQSTNVPSTCVAGTDNENGRWYSVTADTWGQGYISTCSTSQLDSVIYVYSDCSASADCLAQNDDAEPYACPDNLHASAMSFIWQPDVVNTIFVQQASHFYGTNMLPYTIDFGYCPSLCMTCLTGSFCTSCVFGASLGPLVAGNRSCSCDLGFDEVGGECVAQSPTPSRSRSLSRTVSLSSSITPSLSVSSSLTPSSSLSSSVTPSVTATRSPFPSPSISRGPSPSVSVTPTTTPTLSLSPSVTPSVTATHTPSVTPSPTRTPSVSTSVTPTTSPSGTPTATPSGTPTPPVTATPTRSVTPSVTPSVTGTASATPSPLVKRYL